jgi:hypothetical protein
MVGVGICDVSNMLDIDRDLLIISHLVPCVLLEQDMFT